MVTLDVGRQAEWRQVGNFCRGYELLAEGQVAASLKFEKMLTNQARVESACGTWTLKQSGFLHPKITIRDAGTEAEFAVFTPRWSGGGTVEFASGRRFQLKTISAWRGDRAFEDESGKAVVTLHGPHGFLKMAGECVVNEEGPDAAVLAALLWYTRILDMAAASAATTAVVCG
jgi:hypothetical protein